MSSPELNADALNARAAQLTAQSDELYSRVHRRNQAMAAARERAVAATGSASSPDGAVKATVDAGGMLTGLVLTPAAEQLNLRQLSALVVQVAQQAAAQARGAVREVYSPLQNEGVVRDMPVLLPETAPVAQAPSPAPVRRPVQREEDFSGPVMKEEGW